MGRIDSFKDENFFLSNFYPCLITYEDIQYPSSEHAFVAHKILSLLCRRVIAQIEGAGAVKKAGRRLPIRPDWNDVRLAVMLCILIAKFSIPWLAKKLIDTGDAELVEGNWWHDNFWGDCKCEKCKNIPGQNWLGRLLMTVRWYLINCQKGIKV